MIIFTKINKALQASLVFSLEPVVFLEPQPLIFHLFKIFPFLSPYQTEMEPCAASSSGRGGPLALSLSCCQLSLGGPESWALLTVKGV